MALKDHVFVLFALLVSAPLHCQAVSVVATEQDESALAGTSRLVRSEDTVGASDVNQRTTASLVVASSGASVLQQSQSDKDRGSSLAEVSTHSRNRPAFTKSVPVSNGLTARTGAMNNMVEMDFLSGEYPAGPDAVEVRSDISGHVGMSFVPVADFSVSALGRHLNQYGVIIAEANVTLWGPGHEKLAQMRIGPTDHIEGGWVWKELAIPVPVKAHQEYRLTQECAVNMADPFWDGFLHSTNINVHEQTAEAYAYIGKGVSGNEAFKWPVNDDGVGRRAGMMNFRIWVTPTYQRSRCCSSEACIRHIPLEGYMNFNVCMDKCRYAKHHNTLQGDNCMGVEFGYANNCDSMDTCKCTLVREGGCGTYTDDVEWNFFTVAGPAHTVRLTQKHSGRVEVFHDQVWGSVCENGFTEWDAIVVCRQMGMWDGSVIPPIKLPGTGTGKIWMSEIMCQGGEPQIEDCSFGGWGTHACTHSQDIGVRCVLPEPGPRGPHGIKGLQGIEADRTAWDYYSFVKGPVGYPGDTGPIGKRGPHGPDAKDGSAGYLLKPYEVFMVNSFNPFNGLIILPVYVFFAVVSVSSTYGLWWVWTSDYFGNPSGDRLQNYLTDPKAPWESYYGKMGKAGAGTRADGAD